MTTDIERLDLDQAADVPTDAFRALQDAASRWGGRDFLVVGQRDQVLSFDALLAHATAFGELLRSRGIRPGDRVCLALANSAEWAVAAFGVFGVGAVAVPLSTRLVDREVRHCLELVRPAAVVVHEIVRSRRLVDEWPSLATVKTDAGGPIDVLVHGAPGRRWCPPEPRLDEAVVVPRAAADVPQELVGAAAILFTSGTTSAPKGVVLTHRGLVRVAYEVGRRQGLGPSDRFFSVAPFFHCSGLMHAMLTSLLAGATLFTVPRHTTEGSLRVIRDESITVSHGPLPSAAEVLAANGSTGFPSFTRAWAGGTPVQLAAQERALGTRLCSLWGMTETGGCFALTTADDPPDVRHGTAGFPMPGLEFRVVDRHGTPVEHGTPGELCVRGWNVTPGYFRDPDATAAAKPDGWLHTGDVAVRLPDGRFTFMGRRNDIIRVGGENVSPTEIEAVLTKVDGIADAAVIAVPDQRLGEVPVATLVLASGCSVDAVALTDHCRRQLAGFKVPRSFFVVDHIPRTHATSRIQRAAVRADVLAGRATHVS